MIRCLIALTLFMPAGAALAGDLEHGRKLAEANCARCHALDAASASPFKDAPPFRDIHPLYEEGELEDAFNDGIVVAHPAMPDWNMSPDQARALTAFIMSFGEAKK
jgi:cytochrome c